MPRSIWTGTISFGLVTVPVKLFSAVSQKTVRFHQLHAADGVRIQQRRVCPADGEEVAYDDLVKGFEIAPDRYVIIEPEELAALQPEKTKTIEIEDFVEITEIDPLFYDHPYYLVPGPGGAKPYRLLIEAMREEGKVAIARVVLRQKEQLVALRPVGSVLSMATMVFADELVDPDDLEGLPGEETATTDRELSIARQLVDSLAGPWEPDKYRDTYREAVMDLIERKAEGREIAVQPASEPRDSPAPDLMGALQASLEQVRARSGAAATPPPEKKKAPAAKKSPAEKKKAPAGSSKS
jgi:DNA end-binding protein Ku